MKIEEQTPLTEADLGIEKDIEDAEKAYLTSCKLNNVPPEDMKYFRRYIFAHLALHIDIIGALNKRIDASLLERQMK